jgi:hypothetical protein
MIPTSELFDQSTLTLLREHDPVVQRYRRFFALFNWSLLPKRDPSRLWPEPCPHPLSAYVKALLVKLCEQKPYTTQVRRFLIEHPLLVLELGFHPVLNPTAPYGFDVERTVPVSAGCATSNKRSITDCCKTCSTVPFMRCRRKIRAWAKPSPWM